MIDVSKAVVVMKPVKNLKAPFIDTVNECSPIADISVAMDKLTKNKIEFTPWQQFAYKPDCKFTIAHDETCIFLKFFVTEVDLLVRYTQPNDHVYNDSCVEFFVAFDGDTNYYNLEFNSIGTCYLGYGNGDGDIEAAGPEIVRKIKSSFILSGKQGAIKWELALMIPNEAFFRHQFNSLSSTKAKANFYKCGDEMPVRHYLSWNNIESESPNFHLPEFFGDIEFGTAG